MPKFDAKPGEQYTIRRKIFALMGATFTIHAPGGNTIGLCRQKAFRLKEDLRVYTDSSQTTELMNIRARSVIDFSATYDVALASGVPVGSLRRKGLASTFVRDSWLAFDPAGRQIASLVEQGTASPLVRRLVNLPFLFPQHYALVASDGREIARFRQHRNPFVFRLSIAILADDPVLDDLVVLAAGCLLAAIEGRQQ